MIKASVDSGYDDKYHDDDNDNDNNVNDNDNNNDNDTDDYNDINYKDNR